MENRPEKSVSESMEDLFHATITAFFSFLKKPFNIIFLTLTLVIGTCSSVLFKTIKNKEVIMLAQQEEDKKLKEENELLKKQIVERRVSEAYNAGRNSVQHEIEFSKGSRNNRPYQLVSPIYDSN